MVRLEPDIHKDGFSMYISIFIDWVDVNLSFIAPLLYLWPQIISMHHFINSLVKSIIYFFKAKLFFIE